MPDVFPSIHLNGTSAGELTQQYENAYRALQVAAGALAECRPHGRDYYPQGSGMLQMASREFDYMMTGVTTARDYVLALGSYCNEENERRARGDHK